MKYDINHEFVSIASHNATHRIILIHGWGADAQDLLTLGKEITDKVNFNFEVISLQAPEYIQVVRKTVVWIISMIGIMLWLSKSTFSYIEKI